MFGHRGSVVVELYMQICDTQMFIVQSFPFLPYQMLQ